MSGDNKREGVTEAFLTSSKSTAVYDKEDFEKLNDEEVKKLCSDYAAYTRVNLSEEHGQVILLYI